MVFSAILTSRVSIGNPYVSAMCMETSTIPLSFCRTKYNSSMTSINPLYAFFFSFMTNHAAAMTIIPTTTAPPDATANDVLAIPVIAVNAAGFAKDSDNIVPNVVTTVRAADALITLDARTATGCSPCWLGEIGPAAGVEDLNSLLKNPPFILRVFVYLAFGSANFSIILCFVFVLLCIGLSYHALLISHDIK